MEAVKQLPTHANGCYEIRLESIGGLGANLCGKLLGELGAVYLNLSAASFSSYGSEKRGSPVKSFIRWAAPDREVRVSSPVEQPHLLVIFHQNMIEKMAVTAGITQESKVIVNTDRSPQEMREMLKLHAGELICIDAQKLAMDTRSRVNMVLLGAAVKATGFVPLEAAEKLIEDTLGKKYPDMLARNLDGLRKGYEGGSSETFQPSTQWPEVPYQEAKSAWGYATAPLGGVNPVFGSTVSNDLSASREGYIPLFIQEKCINCGLCDTTCPDMVFQFEEGMYKGRKAMVNMGLDYHHCKGCLRCVDICPVEALVMGVEREHPDKKWQVRNKDLIIQHMEFEKTGANSWVNSDSYMEDERI